MPKRQTHSKSRRGCRQCKASHIKCDEGQPACKHCIRRAENCDYSALRHLRSSNLALIRMDRERKEKETAASSNRPWDLSKEANIYHAIESHAVRPSRPDTKPGVHLLELRLMYTYLSCASSLHGVYPEGHHVKSGIGNLFKMAKHCNYLTDILIGASANWLRARNPKDITLIEASHRYSSRSIQECSKQIANGINGSNAERLFLTSMIVAMHAFSGRQFDVLQESDGPMPVLQWLRHFQGVRAIKDAGWKWIKDSEPLVPLREALTVMNVKIDLNCEPFFNYLLEGLGEEKITAQDHAVYTDAVNYLSAVFEDPFRRGLMLFPMSISNRFLELLEGRDPRALTIMGTYLAFMTLSQRSEYLRDPAVREFHLIMKTLPADWLPRMSWAEAAITQCKSRAMPW